MTLGELKELIADIPDDFKVYWEDGVEVQGYNDEHGCLTLYKCVRIANQ